jgi:hypothetical protein
MYSGAALALAAMYLADADARLKHSYAACACGK